MGLLDMVKGLIGGETVQNALESTGLTEQVGGLLGEGAAVAESLGGGVDQAAETIGGVGEVVPGDLGEVVQVATDVGLPDLPVP
ncbi:MAG: hypothetical protein MUF83_04775 [Acidimicrobiales bacterium]|jgi:hypothetical protein|nr:hypothetical protein [Acidimicrobiales bacterium]